MDKNKKNGCMGCLGVLVLIIVVAFLIVSCSSGGNKNKDKDDNTAVIITDAQIAVEKQLKSPSSAKFPWGADKYSISNVSSPDNEGYIRYTVSSYVDADNSFGANIRSNFTVTVDIKEGEDKFFIIDCVIN